MAACSVMQLSPETFVTGTNLMRPVSLVIGTLGTNKRAQIGRAQKLWVFLLPGLTGDGNVIEVPKRKAINTYFLYLLNSEGILLVDTNIN